MGIITNWIQTYFDLIHYSFMDIRMETSCIKLAEQKPWKSFLCVSEGKLSVFVQNGALSHCKPAIQLCRKISSKTKGAYTVDFICRFNVLANN